MPASSAKNAVSFSSGRTTKRFRVALRLYRATTNLHFYEARPARKDHREVDLISGALPLARLWYGRPDAASTIGCAKHSSRSRDAVIRDCDENGSAIGNAGAQGRI